MSKSLIRKLLEKRLEDNIGSISTPLGPLTIIWENVESERDISKPFIIPFIVPAENDSLSLQQTDTWFSGLFQITLVIPANSGSQWPDNVADAIAALFPNNLRMIDTSGFVVTVGSPPTVYSGISDETGYNIPISVTYRANS